MSNGTTLTRSHTATGHRPSSPMRVHKSPIHRTTPTRHCSRAHARIQINDVGAQTSTNGHPTCLRRIAVTAHTHHVRAESWTQMQIGQQIEQLAPIRCTGSVGLGIAQRIPRGGSRTYPTQHPSSTESRRAAGPRRTAWVRLAPERRLQPITSACSFWQSARWLNGRKLGSQRPTPPEPLQEGAQLRKLRLPSNPALFFWFADRTWEGLRR